jgi:hypothetical protein
LEGQRRKPTSDSGQEGFIEAPCRPIKQKQARTGASSFARADHLVQILAEFFSRILFQEITTTAGDAWNKALSAQHAAQTEVDLLELVRVVVGKHLSPGWPKASSLSLATRSPRPNSHSERQPNIIFGHRRSGGFGANEVTQLGKLDSRAKCVGSWEPMKY